MVEALVTDRTILAAKPRIEVGGEPDEMVRDLLLAISLREAEGGLAAVEARFAGSAVDQVRGLYLSLTDSGVLDLGKEVAVAFGPEHDQRELFRGRISALELEIADGDQPHFLVHAEDALMRERRRRFSRLHAAGKLHGILESVAAETGLRPVIRGLETKVDAQVQLNESNLAFLRRLLADYDGDLQVIGRELHMAPRGDIQRGTVALRVGSRERPVHHLRVMADLADQVQHVTLSAFEVASGQPISVTSGAGAALGPGSRRRGAAQILQALGEQRAEHIGGRRVANRAEAQAVADATFARTGRRFLTLEATAKGDPAIRVGTHLEIENAGVRFSNTYYVTSVLHRYDAGDGYVTELTAESAYLGG
jgi:phage protein D